MPQGNESEIIHCICCEKGIVNATYMYPEGEKVVHPEDGTHFVTYGNYGSTVFDPMDGSYAEIAICNACLEQKKSFMYIRSNLND